MKTPRILTPLAVMLAALSAFDSRAAVFALLLTCIALAALPTRNQALPTRRRTLELKVLLVALAVVVIALGRFVVLEAMPGIAEARARDENARAVSRLREILFAEDALRRLAAIDPDRDQIGSAGLLSELSGAMPARGQTVLEHPPLAERFAPRVSTLLGPAFEESAFLYIVCLPGPDGRFTARPSDPIDDEQAERRFVAYAWPKVTGGPVTSTFFIDEHESIKEAKGKGSAWSGAENPPPCDAATNPATAPSFSTWRGKVPRATLPGDTSRD